MKPIPAIPGYDSFWFAAGDIEYPVYRRGEGPGVLVMHELGGMIPECLALAARLVRDGFTVYLPLYYGRPNQKISAGGILGHSLSLCISREFFIFARKKSSPITGFMRALCRRIKDETGGNVGVIGMCLSGSFVLSLLADDSVIAPVTSQPSLPIGRSGELGVDPQELKTAVRRTREENIDLLGLRFTKDPLCRPAKFEALEREFGDRFRKIEIDPKEGKHMRFAHAVLTFEFRRDPKSPTHRAYREVVAFLKQAFERDRART